MTNPYVAQMRQWRQTLTKDQRWAILISADPDALASALALKRIMAHRVRGVDIFRINEVTRPDNLAMIRYLRIPAKLWQPEKAISTSNFAWWTPSPTTTRRSRASPSTSSSTIIPSRQASCRRRPSATSAPVSVPPAP